MNDIELNQILYDRIISKSMRPQTRFTYDYVEHIASAFEIVHSLVVQEFSLIDNDIMWTATFKFNNKLYTARSSTPAHAICLAAFALTESTEWTQVKVW
jgi:hypothetical protein